MTHAEAQHLAGEVRTEASAATAVEKEGRFFVVTVKARTGSYTLRDAADWAWLRRQMVDGG